MKKLTPSRALRSVKDDIGLRAVAVALYRVMTSENPVLVARNEERAKCLETLMGNLTEGVQARFLSSDAKKEEEIPVISRKEYENNWQKYGGREICMVEEETTVKNPGVKKMMKILNDAQTTSNNFFDTLNRAIGRVVGAAEQIKVGMEVEEELPEGEQLLKKYKVNGVLKHMLKKESERELVKHILILWGKKAAEEETKEILPFSDICDILGNEKLAKTLRVLLAGKNVVMVGHNLSLILKMMHYISSFWPKRLEVTSKSVPESLKSKKKGIFVVGAEKAHDLRKKVENTVFINLEKPLEKKLQNDRLLGKINKTLELESEKSKREFLKDEILSLFSIVEDVKDILSREEHNIRMKDLKKELTKKHPKEVVDYLLKLLEQEESILMKHIISSSKPRFEVRL